MKLLLKSLIIALLLLPMLSLRAQSTPDASGSEVYSDAQKLLSYLRSGDNTEIINLLLKYGLDLNDVSDNAFLNAVIPGLAVGIVSPTPEDFSLERAKSSGGVLSGLSTTFTPAVLVDGLASITAARFREELTIAFLDEFIKAVDSLNTNHRLEGLMPSTVGTVLEVKSEVWKFKQYLTTLKESLLDDIANLPANISPYALSRLPDGTSFNQYMPFLVTDLIVQKGINNINPLETLGNWDKKAVRFGSGVNEISVFSAFIRNSYDEQGNLLDDTALSNLVTNPQLRNCFLGLLVAKESKVTGRLSDSQANLVYGLTRVELVNELDRVIALVKSFKATLDSELSSLEKVTTHVISVFRSFELELASLTGPIDVVAVIDLASKMKGHIEDKKIGLAVQDFVKLLNALNVNQAVTDKISEYGFFIANLAQAQTGDEVAALLEDVILPVGGYRLKRQQKFTFGLQAYPGIGGGLSTSSASNFSNGGQVGIISPIGFDFGWGSKAKKAKNGKNKAFSIFISVLDLGPLTGWHIANVDDESLTYTEDFEWKHVVSPGVFLIHHTKSVVSYGVYAQHSPFSLDITSENNVLIENANVTRFGLFVAVDIPLFEFWTQKRTK